MKISIGCMELKVRRVKGLRDDEGNACWGLLDEANGEILLERKQTADHAFLTLWHEVKHLIKAQLGVPYDDHDESEIEGDARGTVSVLHHNKCVRSIEEFKLEWRSLR